MLGVEVRGLSADLAKEKEDHADTRTKVTFTERQASEHQRLHHNLQKEFVALDGYNKQLVEERALLKEKDLDQQNALLILQSQIYEMHAQHLVLMRENTALEAECVEAKQRGAQEYQESAELCDTIMGQFAKGYGAYKEWAREKMTAAGLDDAILDSSDDESDVGDDVDGEAPDP